MRANTADSFWLKVDKAGDCWLWMGKWSIGNDYGAIKIRQKVWMTHRLAWTLVVGPIPDGQCVLHRCDTPRCVRPDHLFLGTQIQNVDDRQKKQRQARGERSGASKLTDSTVAEIRALYAAGGVSQRALGRRFGTDNSTICRVVNRERWTHV